jgi:hypothetical protein
MGHLYNDTRDLEGILHTVPAIETTLIGVLTGHRLKICCMHISILNAALSDSFLSRNSGVVGGLLNTLANLTKPGRLCRNSVRKFAKPNRRLAELLVR